MTIQRLWNDIRVPVFSRNLIDEKIVPLSLNDEVAKVGLKAFDAYLRLKNTSDPTISGSATRRKRQHKSGPTVQSNVSEELKLQNGSQLTMNDYFFQHQRVNGYLNGAPILSKSAALKELNDHLLDTVEIYLQLIGGRAAHLLPSINNGIISLDTWAAIQRGRGSYHENHVHENVILSGVYYSKVPSSSAPLVFHKPNQNPDGTYRNTSASEKNNQLHTDLHSFEPMNSIIKMKPKRGQVILFPPWLLHGVPHMKPDSSDADVQLPRISFAFNLSGPHAGGDPWSIIQESTHLSLAGHRSS